MSLISKLCSELLFSSSSNYCLKKSKCLSICQKYYLFPRKLDFLSSRKTFCTQTYEELEKKSGEYQPLKYESILEERRSQAERSVLVQVHSEQSCCELYDYCSSISPVTKMFHYRYNENHFVLIEFGENSLNKVYAKSTHLEKGHAGSIPVRSPLLWFRARPKSKTRAPLPAQSSSQLNPPPRNKLQVQLPVTLNSVDVDDYLSAARTLDEGMEILYSVSCLDEMGVRLRYLTAKQVETSLRGMFPNCKAIPFGSSVNGFGRIGCDLDIHLDYDASQIDTGSRLVFQSKGTLPGVSTGGSSSFGSNYRMQRQMEVIADMISVFLPGCTNVKRILKAKVPIVKFDQEMTVVQCDLSMSNMSGVYMSELLWLWGEADRRLRLLACALKSWAEAAGLTHPTKVAGPWITNFALTLMAIFYLQSAKMLPTLDLLISSARPEDIRFADEINCTFLRDPHLLPKSHNSSSVSSLLIGFFRFYSTFDFGTSGLSVCSGCTVVKPDQSSLYIVNPLERTLNVAKNVGSKEVERLRIEVRNALWILENNNASFYEFLLQVSNEMTGGKEVFQSRYIHRPNRMVIVKDLFNDTAS